LARVVLRVARGPLAVPDETALFDGDEAPPPGWAPEVPSGRDAFVLEQELVLGVPGRLLLADEVRLAAGLPALTSAVLFDPVRPGVFGTVGRAGQAMQQAGGATRYQVGEVVDLFSDPRGRRAFARAVRRPRELTQRQQHLLLFLVLLTAVWLWVVGLTALAFAGSRLTGAWSEAFTLFFASLATNLFIPIPIEPLALASAGDLGLWVAPAAGAGKAVGAWIIFALGPVLRRAVGRLERDSRLTHRIMLRAERFARRFGYVALGLMLAIPFSPLDIIPVYLFSTLGLRLGPFLAAVFLGFALRILAVMLLVLGLLG
jgi:hypothetical protein